MTATHQSLDFPPAGVSLLVRPLDCYSSYRRGAARGPAAIRKILVSGMCNCTRPTTSPASPLPWPPNWSRSWLD
jgi:arginase family enzyme